MSVDAKTCVAQSGTTPELLAYAGGVSDKSSDLAVGSIGIIRVLFNGASSKFIVNDNTPITGNFGANDMGGFTLGASGFSSGSLWSNIQIYEVILRDGNTDEAAIYAYLANKVSLGLYGT